MPPSRNSKANKRKSLRAAQTRPARAVTGSITDITDSTDVTNAGDDIRKDKSRRRDDPDTVLDQLINVLTLGAVLIAILSLVCFLVPVYWPVLEETSVIQFCLMIPILWDEVRGRVTGAMPSITLADCHLASQILHQAAWFCSVFWEQLEEILGLDVPPVPELSLAGINVDSAVLYWNQPEDDQFACLKFAIVVNGITVGEFKLGETHITISGLRPRTFYSIKVRVTSPAGTISTGPSFNIKTYPAPPSYKHELPPATVHGTSTPSETSLLPSTNRDIGGLSSQRKRAISGRRNSPAASGSEQPTNHALDDGCSDDDESPESIQRMTERLESLRAEKERVDNEIAEEELESKSHLAELTRQRDRLKQELKEKEDTNSELRKHGNHLDRVYRAAQSRKTAKEKQLQQKKAERQKLKEDTERWARETAEMKRDIQEMIEEKARIVAASEKEVAEIRKIATEYHAANKSLEEDIRILGGQIKELEKKHEQINDIGSDELAQEKIDQENDQIWEARKLDLQAQAAAMWQALQQSELEKQQAETQLAWWMERRATYPDEFAPIPSLDLIPSIQRSRSRRNRQNSSRTSTISSPSANYHASPMAFSSTAAIGPSFPTPSPFFNMGNGATVAPVAEQTGLSQGEAEILAGNGPMSPAADNLLPSNLFRDEDASVQQYQHTAGQESLGNVHSELLLGHAMSTSDASAHGPHTPGSTSSRANSIFSSPHDSLHNLQGYQARQDQFTEADERSISSSSAPFNPSAVIDTTPLAHSKLANLFSTTFRPRDKIGTQEPPLLGTLKQGQSQSFPRNLDDGLDTSASRRRRGSHGNWANPVAGLLNRNSNGSGESGLIMARTGSGRKSRLNMFGGKFDGRESASFADQPPSSRPSSTYSYDPILGRPSSDSQRFGWAVGDSIPNRSSPLGANWSSGPWSHAPSRRPSVQHGSTSNLSVGSTPLEPDGYLGSFSKPAAELAPIGTRPQSSQRPITPKLNPAAPSFKTLFGAKKTAKSEKQGSKSADKSKDKENEKIGFDDTESIEESSPPNPRLSRDAQSITTAASTADSYESFDRSTSGTPSEALIPSGPKETLMQKITRKSSSSKFNVPWAKERGLFSKRSGEPSTPGEVDEDNSSEGQLGKSAESTSSTPQQEKAGRTSISWQNIRRKSKKGDQALNDATERDTDGDADDF
ncbi:hypothetical protein P7C71_g6207, partial [Lecanoromycetidae sp. Uapishka_2]